VVLAAFTHGRGEVENNMRGFYHGLVVVGKIDGSIEKTEIIIRVDEPLMDGFSRVAVEFDASEALQNSSDARWAMG
jgi:hypothetical protein